ncbi:hypothetical protein WAX74_15305 [Psychrobacillus sp. FJAT-51614]|uniref:DUF4181 domain-containing protein n=2 Tax=Psychrobacillus mangrovi TaxID=3117745 RepID=A0ABU8F7K0_9BACI
MVIIIYILIGLYAVLTGMAGMKQWKEVGFRVQTFLFIIVSISILVILFIPNKDWMFILLIIAFVLFHILAVAEGMLTNRRLTYSHHIIRFTFHCIIVLLVYKFIK